jgi:hypothetical protein
VSRKFLLGIGIVGILIVVGLAYRYFQSQPLGRELLVSPCRVFAGDGVGDADARAVVDVLKREGVVGEKPVALQIRKNGRRYELRYPIADGADPLAGTRAIRKLGEAVSAVFKGAPVDVHLCDGKFITLRVVDFEPIRPDLPVKVFFRSSVGGTSLVARYTNTSDKYLTIRVQLQNRTVGDYKEVTLNIAPNATTEHGWLQGWDYRSGERITIKNAEYETLDLVVP